MPKGELVKIEYPSLYGGDKYGNEKELEELILYKKVKSITKDKVELENGVVLTIECSEADCCADGSGEFEFPEFDVPLDALITDFIIHKQIDVPDDDTIVRRNTITMYHNQNPIINANAETNAGNGAYYYSVTSLVIGKIHFPFVEA